MTEADLAVLLKRKQQQEQQKVLAAAGQASVQVTQGQVSGLGGGGGSEGWNGRNGGITCILQWIYKSVYQ